MAKGKCGENKCPDSASCSSAARNKSNCVPDKSDPSRLSRIAEKSELQNLNDRLACYIDRARKLEIENNRLKIQLENTQNHSNEGLNNVKDIYEQKLNQCKCGLQESEREKSMLSMEVQRLREENKEFRQDLEKACKDLYSAENRASLLDCQLDEALLKLKNTGTDFKKCQDTVECLTTGIERLKKQLEECRKNLEYERLKRVEMETNLCGARDTIQRNKQCHEEEKKESNANRMTEINEMNNRLTTQYDAKLRQALHDLREEYEGKIRTNRCEIELIYENKIQALEKTAKYFGDLASGCQDELQSSRNCISLLNDHGDELNLQINQLRNHIRELEVNAECERARCKNNIASLEGEIQKFKCEISRRIKDYQDLMDIKVSLDMELAAYDKLLKGEERRLGACNICNEEDEANQKRAEQDCQDRNKHRSNCQQSSKKASAPKYPEKSCAQKCPQKCPQKCAQKCPQKCPQKGTQNCPQKCTQKSPPKCQMATKMSNPSFSQSQQSSSSQFSDSKMLFDEASVDFSTQFLPVKRSSSSQSIFGQTKRQRTLQNDDESGQHYFVI